MKRCSLQLRSSELSLVVSHVRSVGCNFFGWSLWCFVTDQPLPVGVGDSDSSSHNRNVVCEDSNVLFVRCRYQLFLAVLSSHCVVVTANESLVNKLWYRSKAKSKQLLWGGAPETPTLYPSPIVRLPQELIEVIVSYLVHDKLSLLACSMTCYSWYIAGRLLPPPPPHPHDRQHAMQRVQEGSVA